MNKIKLVGFVKEYHNNEQAIPFEDFISSRSGKYDFEKILKYLRQGDLVFGWMSYIMDLKTNLPLVPNNYHTDGIWVWPAYFPYFIARYPLLDNDIDHEFISYLENKDYTFQLDASYETRNKAEFQIMVIEQIYGPQKW
nr:hypothetical protein [uncultured Mucilaginibacter sp.]